MLRIIILTAIAVVVLGEPPVKVDRSGRYVTTACSEHCEDEKGRCGIPGMKAFCDHRDYKALVREKCPRLCGTCTPCSATKMRCSLDCKDENKWCPTMYKFYCNHPAYGLNIRKQCKKTCAVCKSCEPEKVPRCDPGCRDFDPACKYWDTKMNYCEGSIYSKWMKNRCPLSCGECRYCALPTIPATTRRPVFTRPQATTKYIRTTPKPITRPTKPTPNKCERGRTVGVSVADQCLNTHNYYRCLHGAQPLRYDYGLERSAQRYANRLPTMSELQSSRIGVDRGDNVGENMAWTFDRSRKLDVNQAISQWYAGGLNYDYDDQGYTHESEHFTQVIWRETETIGCAVKKYKDETYIVAHYRTMGNIDNDYMYNVRKPKDTCKSKCPRGSCQGNQPRFDDDCDCDRSGNPICYGLCVVHCEQPQDFYDEWVASCEGAISCTCSLPSDWARGAPKGAMCR